MHKTMKTVLFSTMVTAVLGAGTLSARQLRADTKGFAACKGSCSSTTLHDRLHLRLSFGVDDWFLLVASNGSPAAGKIAGTISSLHFKPVR